MFDQGNIRRVLAVSHFYRLPRIKLAYQRVGYDVYTVPAAGNYLHFRTVLREIPALWLYVIRPAERAPTRAVSSIPKDPT